MRVWSLIAAVIVGSCAATAVAQEAAVSKSNGWTIAVVDVGHILDKHPTMKSEIEAINSQMETADRAMTQERDGILKQMEQLREKYTEGTPEYEREEKSIAEQDTSFRLKIVKMRKKFDKARATVLYNVYTEVQNLVKYASEQMGVQVVLHVKGTREKLDPEKPDNVRLMMSQEVLHFNPQVDLTEWVLNGLKTRTAKR